MSRAQTEAQVFWGRHELLCPDEILGGMPGDEITN